MPNTLSRGLALFFGLVIQLIAGTLLFIVLLLLAAGLYVLVHYLESQGWVPRWLVQTAGAFEVGIFIFDCVMFALFLLSEAIKFCRTLREDLKRK